jgi:hypothetical protein
VSAEAAVSGNRTGPTGSHTAESGPFDRGGVGFEEAGETQREQFVVDTPRLIDVTSDCGLDHGLDLGPGEMSDDGDNANCSHRHHRQGQESWPE